MSIFHSGIDPKIIGNICNKGGGRLHFVGVGGVGMFSLAAMMLERGITVTGSDARSNGLTEELRTRGADIRYGIAPELSAAADLTVYTLAVSEDNADVAAALANGGFTASRAELLGAIMTDYKVRLGISGSHGKSTVTAMTDSILRAAGKRPTTAIGAHLSDTGLPFRSGEREYLVYEACEYKDSFLRFSPTAAVYTSLEHDHTDYFSTLDALVSSFSQSVAACPLPIINADVGHLLDIALRKRGACATYGESGGDIRGEISRRENGRYSLKIRHASGHIPEIILKIPGRHNAENALSAAALAVSVGIDSEAIATGLSEFSGLVRRTEYIGSVCGKPVYYDYAHHPTEISACIRTLREAEGLPVTVIFKPHTYSRTRAFLRDFASALSLADRVLLLEVDPVREKYDGGGGSSELARGIGGKAALVSSEEAVSLALSNGDALTVLMGAGEVSDVLAGLKAATRVE